MSYYIKQTRGSINTLHTESINGTLSNNNKEYTLAEELLSSKSYYIKFSATTSGNTPSFYLKLTNNDRTLSQTIEAFGGNGIFQTVFSPNTDGYQKILWEQASGSLNSISNIELKQLQNIVPENNTNQEEKPYITKLGVQGPSSLLMCINGEKIRIGKNKIYQLDDKNIKIRSLCFYPKQSDFFIADYEYYKDD